METPTLITTTIIVLVAVGFGWSLGLVTPFGIKWLQRQATRAQLRLSDQIHKQKQLHGKLPQQPVAQQAPVTPGTP